MNLTPLYCIDLQYGGDFVQEYEVYCADRVIGSISLEPQGLYYKIFSYCERISEKFPKLYAVCGDHKTSIGVYKPQGNGFVMERLLSIKSWDLKGISFQIGSMDRQIKGETIPVFPDRPFPYISRIGNAQFCREDEQPGILYSPKQI